MSNLKIKGIGLIYVDEATGRKIENMQADEATKKLNPYIRTKKWSGFLNEIGGVLHEEEKTYNDKKTQDGIEEYNKWRKSFLSKPASERAKDVQMAEFMYIAATDNYQARFTPEMKDQIVKIQEKFFLENPYRCFCDAYLINEIIKPVKTKMASKIFGGLLRVVENQILTDMQCARYKH